MLLGRGVIFELFFAIVALFSLLFWLETNSRRYLTVYVLANILGVYSMITHVYFCVFLFAVTLILGAFFKQAFNKRMFKKFIIANLLITFFSLLLLSPFLLSSGVDLIKRSIVRDTGWATVFWKLPQVTQNYSSYFASFKYGFYIQIILSAFFYFVSRNKTVKKLLLITVCLSCFPTIIYFFQHFFIPHRAVAFCGLSIPVFFVCLNKYFINHKKNFLFVTAYPLEQPHHC